MSEFKDGGPWSGKSKCHKCGQEFDDYRAGSWDWEPHPCPECKAYEMILKMTDLRDVIDKALKDEE